MRHLTPEDIGNLWLGAGALGVLAAAALRVNFREIDPVLGAALPVALGGISLIFLWKAIGRLAC